MLAVSDAAANIGSVGGVIIAILGVLWCFLIQFRRTANVQALQHLNALSDDTAWKDLIDAIKELILKAPRAMLPGFIMIVLGIGLSVGSIAAQHHTAAGTTGPDTTTTSTR